MMSSGDVDSDVGFPKPLNKLVYLPKLIVTALIQCVEEHSNFDMLCALYEQFNERIPLWSIAADFDVVINDFKIGAIFLRRPRNLPEKAGCHAVRRLCCSVL